MTNNIIKKVYKNGTEYQIYASGGAAGAGDVTGPSSATSGNVAAFDGATGKLIKDGGIATSSIVKTSGNQTIAGTKTFSTSPVVPSKSTAAGNNATTIATEAQVYLKQDALATQTAYTSKGSATKVPQITTNSLGQVTGITEVDIQTGGNYTAGNGIDITNDEIGLDGTYELVGTQGPAPDGFHVPLTTERQAVYDIWTTLGGGNSDGTNFGIALKLPFAGNRNTSAGVYNQGSTGMYLSSSRYSTDGAYGLYFNSTAIYPQTGLSRAGGSSVRCFKDTPTIPTSSWTKLYGTSIEAGGIFWSSTDGLISLSSNGQTWITIADKNLGATTVWSSGSTLSETNCGKYFQRGNNYGFAWTGSVTTSSTQVDASAYGPGNYYSSSTFITGNGRWDTTDNGNLRGGETGVVSGNLVLGDKLYKIVTSTTAPASGTASNIITIVTD